VRPFPRLSGMVLTDPSGVRAEDALPRSHQAQRRESPATGPGERKYTLEMKVKFWSNTREPSIRSNTVNVSDGRRLPPAGSIKS
jgi:hypothetical protein